MKPRRLDVLLSLIFAASLLVPSTAQSPVKVYILAGQSNMQGKGAIEGEGGNSLRSLVRGDSGQDYRFLVDDADAWVERQDVWVYLDQAPRPSKFGGLTPGYGSSGGQIGPELGFGHGIGDALEEQVLVIKACWGGKSLGHNFLPPSVGQYPEPQTPADPGFYYHEILRIVRDVVEGLDTTFPGYAGQGVEIAGFGWHQGWNDQYGGMDQQYEANLAAFIRDIRSVEQGLGVPDLPFVIVSSGMIQSESPVVQGQLAVADADKYPEFVGNVAVVNTHEAYGPDEITFKFDKDGRTEKVGYHWNNHARSYLHIGLAMASEMAKLERPTHPSRLRAFGTAKGVQLQWQLGREAPRAVEVRRNGERLDVAIPPSRTAFTDVAALPGANRYELVLDLPSGERTLSAACNTSVVRLEGYRSLSGVTLGWEARGRYEAFRLSRDGEVIADSIAPDVRTFEDQDAPVAGDIVYSIQPTRGEVTPARAVVRLGSVDSGGALIYEPFDYPSSADGVQDITGKGGALGTRGSYVYLSDKPGREPATLAKSLSFGALPVTGNHGSTHRWSEGGSIELDGSLEAAGLLEDGATLWMSYVFICELPPSHSHRSGGGAVTLRSQDMQEGVGFRASGRQYETVVVVDGEEQRRRITGTRPNTPTLVVARITWGKNGENDSFVPFQVGPDLDLPAKEGRHSVPFNIDQTKIHRLVLSGEGQFDEIRVGPTFSSVVGGGR